MSFNIASERESSLTPEQRNKIVTQLKHLLGEIIVEPQIVSYNPLTEPLILTQTGIEKNEFNALIIPSGTNTERPLNPPSDGNLLLRFNSIVNTLEYTQNSIIKIRNGNLFGQSCDIQGNTVVVGVRNERSNNIDNFVGVGQIYIFNINNERATFIQKLEADDAELNDKLGESCAISGNYIVAGAPQDGETGKAYVFFKSGETWVQTQKLLDISGATNDQFGASCSIYGDYIVIGANNHGDENEGSAYIFYNSGGTWVQTQKLTPSDVAVDQQFGLSCAISETRLVIGAPNDVNGTGAVYVFHNSGGTWVQIQKLQANDGIEEDNFGQSCDITETSIIVGAYLKSNGVGAAYVFNLNNAEVWTQTQKLLANEGNGQNGALFGYSCAIDGRNLIVGANSENNEEGAAYIYHRNIIWTPMQRIESTIDYVWKQLNT